MTNVIYVNVNNYFKNFRKKLIYTCIPTQNNNKKKNNKFTNTYIYTHRILKRRFLISLLILLKYNLLFMYLNCISTFPENQFV